VLFRSLVDQGLEVMDQIEVLVDKAKEQEQELSAQEKVFQEFLAQAKQEQARIEGEIEDLRQHIAAQEKKCNPKILETYKQLSAFFNTHGGNVLAPVKGQVCSACGTKVLPNDQVILSRRKDLIQCKTCSRILYLPGRAAVN
jgi:uncharacterized protein